MTKDSDKADKKISDLSRVHSEIRFRRLFETAQDGIILLDPKTGMITEVNTFLINMLGYSHEEFIQKKIWEVGAFKDIEASKEAFIVLQKEEYIRYENLPLKAKDGRLIEVEFVSSLYLVGNERVIQCNIRDITERATAQKALTLNEATLREQTTRDHLTGLFNRRYMEETLERELHRAARKKLTLGVMMIDIDYFKLRNDTDGHAAGDTIFRSLGKILVMHVREEDVACRYGGDEFLLILPDTTQEIVLKRAEYICERAKQLRFHFNPLKTEIITLSIGVAFFPKKMDPAAKSS
jgi:diguanylate cyclase (GGDEF)-like protein/PAS domain S-box-containing protein